MEIFSQKFNKLKINFSLLDSDNIKKLIEVFLNLGYLLGYYSYSGYRISDDSFELNFYKGNEGNRIIGNDIGKIDLNAFSRYDAFMPVNIQIPKVIIKEYNPVRIVLNRKATFIDILRLLIITVVFPFFILLLIYSNYVIHNPKTKYTLPVVVTFYLVVLYMTRNLLAPMQTTVDKIRRIISVRKLFFIQNFPLDKLEKIEITGEVAKKLGTFTFQIFGIFKDGKKHQFQFTEIPLKEEDFNNTLKQLLLLFQNLFEIEVVNKVKPYSEYHKRTF